jgi:hypothetical protein
MARRILTFLSYLLLTLLSLWAAAALYFDLPLQSLNAYVAAAYAALVLAAFFLRKPRWQGRLFAACAFALVLLWWFNIPPSNDRTWQPDVARTAWADLDADRVTIHNIRNCDYRTETDYTVNWDTRTVDLSSIHGADVFITYWGSPWIAHPIISFHYGQDQYLAFSIETRKEAGEAYSAVTGFFRQFELVYTVADERDVVRLRTNYRQGEDVYLYRFRIAPEPTRALFLEYVKSLNRLHHQPAWYNALTHNCTTDIRRLNIAATHGNVPPFDWRILANGRLDQLMYERKAFVGDLPFDEMKQRAHINAAARAADKDPDFSRLIRAGRPGF